MRNASYIDNSQLGIADFLIAAFFLALGWQQDANGEWVQGNGIPLPGFNGEAARFRQRFLYFRVYVGGKTRVKLFDKAKGDYGIHNTNLEALQLTGSAVRLIPGMIIREDVAAAAAPAADVSKPAAAEIAALVFEGPANSEVLNGRVDLDISGKSVLKDDTVAHLIGNTDGINHYHRFDQVRLQVGETPLEMEINFDVAPDAGTYLEVILPCWEAISASKA